MMFENPVIASASQTVGPIRRGIFEFECHVILSSAKPRLPQVDCCSSFEYHVILSSAHCEHKSIFSCDQAFVIRVFNLDPLGTLLESLAIFFSLI